MATLAILVAVYACIELREMYPRGSEIREALKTWRYMLGLTVFFLVWLRITARLAGKTPPIRRALPSLCAARQRAAAHDVIAMTEFSHP